MSQTLELTQDLMARRSVTPADEGCQAVMTARLAALGFKIEPLRYGNVENFWATSRERRPGVLLRRPHRRGAHRAAGGVADRSVRSHGPGRHALRAWRRRHEERAGRDGDRRRGIRAALIPKHNGTIAFLITSDEEGPSVDGTKRVVETLAGAR